MQKFIYKEIWNFDYSIISENELYNKVLINSV